MPDPESQPTDAPGAPSATDEGHPQGIVDNLPEWKKAIESLTDPALKESLQKKIEGYDKRFTERMTKMSEREREIAQVAADLKAAKATPPQTAAQAKTEGRKILDALSDQASDPATREGIRQLRDAIREETNIEKLQETVSRLEKKLQDSEQVSHVSRKSELAKEFKVLEEEYGLELVEKHRDTIEQNALKWPGNSAEKWLLAVADLDEVKQALRIHLKKQGTKTNGESADGPKKPANAPAASTKPSPVSDQYRGKNSREARQLFDKAIGDSVKAGLSKLGLGGR